MGDPLEGQEYCLSFRRCSAANHRTMKIKKRVDASHVLMTCDCEARREVIKAPPLAVLKIETLQLPSPESESGQP